MHSKIMLKICLNYFRHSFFMCTISKSSEYFHGLFFLIRGIFFDWDIKDHGETWQSFRECRLFNYFSNNSRENHIDENFVNEDLVYLNNLPGTQLRAPTEIHFVIPYFSRQKQGEWWSFFFWGWNTSHLRNKQENPRLTINGKTVISYLIT